MTIRDLADASIADVQIVSADVCVIGGGIAGLMAARRLAAGGLRVVVVESGRLAFDDDIHALHAVDDDGSRFAHALDGRFRGFGGTSAHWGGRMLPLTQHDADARPWFDAPAWPFPLSELEQYRAEIESFFRVDGSSYEEDLLASVDGYALFPRADPDILCRWPKWPSFRRCNLANVLTTELRRSDSIAVWLSATVCGFDVDRAAGRLQAVEARTLDGKALRVAATAFLFTAGTIETTRLLSWLDGQNDNRIFAGCNAFGRYFCDHLSCGAGALRVVDAVRTNRLFGYHFTRGTRRNLHFELSPAAQAAEQVGSAYAQIALGLPPDSALDIIKNLLRGLQRGALVLPARDAARLFVETGDLIRLAYWRYGRAQLFIPRDTCLTVSLVAEQFPRASNRITLSDTRDRTGVPRAHLHWTPGDEDEATLQALVRRLRAYWTRAGFDHPCPVVWNDAASGTGGRLVDGATDCAHPSGTLRMGHDPAHAVVDADLRCHALPNVSVASAAVFPSAGSANPTLTIMQLALRAADALLRRAA